MDWTKIKPNRVYQNKKGECRVLQVIGPSSYHQLGVNVVLFIEHDSKRGSALFTTSLGNFAKWAEREYRHPRLKEIKDLPVYCGPKSKWE